MSEGTGVLATNLGYPNALRLSSLLIISRCEKGKGSTWYSEYSDNDDVNSGRVLIGCRRMIIDTFCVLSDRFNVEAKTTDVNKI
jgi:hypothetical protein